MIHKEVRWTKQQRNAIDARGDVLVTASAGTGKTAVLSRRCVELICDPQRPVDVNRILVLTFTDAAAGEMKTRIASTLREEFQRTHNPWLKKQVLILDGADISTIHSFCKKIITDNFYELGIDPQFKIIDTDEEKFIKTEILECVIEQAWCDPELADKMSLLLKGRNVKDISSGFLGSIIKVSEMLNGVVSLDDWFNRAKGESIGDAREKQKDIIEKKIKICMSELERMRLLDKKLLDGFYSDNIETVNEYFKQGLSEIEQYNFIGCLKTIEFLKGIRQPFKSKPRNREEGYYSRIKEIGKDAIDTFAELRSLALMNPDYEMFVGNQTDVQTRIFLTLLDRFRKAYAQRKHQLNCMDFSDLEHYALKLLLNEDGHRTQTAVRLSHAYDYIFVDEYQDVNQVQDSIVRLVSRGENLFVVGDVKQSIYSWRQAKPEIFMSHLNRASEEPIAGMEQRVYLNTNFRSRKEILDYANDVFAKLMNEHVGGMDYDQSSHLAAGADYESLKKVSRDGAVDKAVEFYLLDDKPNSDQTDADQDYENDDDKQENDEDDGNYDLFSSAQKQACFIAKRIKAIVGEGQGSEFKILDSESKQYRDVQYGDIVILMRSLSVRVNDFVEILRMAGIPVSSSVAGGYFETTEITDMISLLKVLDNRQRDIEFASLLRCPLFSFSDSELAVIRIHGNGLQKNGAGFYDDAVNYCDSGKDESLRKKLSDMLSTINRWQILARRGNLAEMIWQVIRQTGYLSFVSGLPNGKQRRANLIKLHERAIQFEGFVSSVKGVSLTRFVEFIEKIFEQGSDWAEAEPESGCEQAVRIMSVHKSKGLEFPVVFLAGLEREFNQADSYGECLCDESLTLGLRIVDSERKLKLDSLRHQVIAQIKQDTTIAEELRILYVAITRAKERLILVGSMKTGQAIKQLFNSSTSEGGSLPVWIVRKSNSHLSWLLSAAAEYAFVHRAVGTDVSWACGLNELFDFSIIDAQGVLEICKEIIDLKKSKSHKQTVEGQASQCDVSAALQLEKIKSNLIWRYPFEAGVNMPAKSSVSRLTHNQDEFVIRNFNNALDRRPTVLEARGQQIDSRIIGTASHMFIQKVDLDKADQESYLKVQLADLVEQGLMPQNVSSQIDLCSIAKFFRSELAELIRDPGNKVYREWPFTFLYTEKEKDNFDEGLIVQGIIDMLIVGSDDLWIIDFKTDSVSEQTAREHSEMYNEQISLYAQAAQNVWGKKVSGAWLYYLKCDSSVKMV